MPSVARAMAEIVAGMATGAYTVVAAQPNPSSTPPSSDPTIDPLRPTPFARCDESDDRRVEAVDGDDDEAQEEQQPLQRRDRMAVDERLDVDDPVGSGLSRKTWTLRHCHRRATVQRLSVYCQMLPGDFMPTPVHEAADEAVVFSFSDRPVQEALQLFREECSDG
jgi:hypothetical protein